MENIDQQLQEALDLSFNENNSSDNNYVNIYDVTKNIEIAEELFLKCLSKKTCNICYEEEKQTIKCGICETYYCKMCLIRIMTQFQKCSVCINKFDVKMIIKIHEKNNKSFKNHNYQNNKIEYQDDYLNNLKDNNFDNYKKEYDSSDSDLEKWIKKNDDYKNKIISLCDDYLINPVKRKKKTKYYKCIYDYDNYILYIKSNNKEHNPIILNINEYDYKQQQLLFLFLDILSKDIDLFNKEWNNIVKELKNKNNIKMINDKYFQVF